MLSKKAKEAIKKINFMQDKIDEINKEYSQLQEYEASLKAWIEVFKREVMEFKEN